MVNPPFLLPQLFEKTIKSPAGFKIDVPETVKSGGTALAGAFAGRLDADGVRVITGQWHAIFLKKISCDKSRMSKSRISLVKGNKARKWSWSDT